MTDPIDPAMLAQIGRALADCVDDGAFGATDGQRAVAVTYDEALDGGPFQARGAAGTVAGATLLDALAGLRKLQVVTLKTTLAAAQQAADDAAAQVKAIQAKLDAIK